MATNDKCRQSALGDLTEETFKSLATAGTQCWGILAKSWPEVTKEALITLPLK